MEAPNPISPNTLMTPKPNQDSSKLIKEKKLQLKGKNEQEYAVNLKLFEKSIVIEASIIKDIEQRKYSNNLSYEDFTQLNSFFALYSKVEELYELFEDMKSDEFKISNNNPEFIEFYLMIEVRKKIIEIPIKLLKLKNDMNDTLKNLCEIVQDIKNKEIADLRKKNKNLENQISKIKEKLENEIKNNKKIKEEIEHKITQHFENLQNKTKEIEEYKKIINEDKKRIDDLEKEKNEDRKKIDDLQRKINEDEKQINDLKEKIKSINDKKVENFGKEITNYTKENNNRLELNKKDEFYDSYKYIINNSISINSVIINAYELAQINNGIKRQKNKNIKKLNLLYKCTRDGDSWDKYHSKCDGHQNLLTLVKTTEGRKFGGFSSLILKSSGGGQKDGTAFIFSLDKKKNYYINKGKIAVYFYQRGPIFGQIYGQSSEFTLQCDKKPSLSGENCVDDTGTNCCYDYGKGEKYVLAGKNEFNVLEYEVFELEFTE